MVLQHIPNENENTNSTYTQAKDLNKRIYQPKDRVLILILGAKGFNQGLPIGIKYRRF
jgi:hypothetical protein